MGDTDELLEVSMTDQRTDIQFLPPLPDDDEASIVKLLQLPIRAGIDRNTSG